MEGLRQSRGPFHQLPTELFVGVVCLSLPQIEHITELEDLEKVLYVYTKTLFSRRGIGRQWRSIIDGTPSLWPYLSSVLPLHINETIIVRSSNRPLAIECGSGEQRLFDLKSYGSPMHFLHLVKHTQHRWSSYTGVYKSGIFDVPLPLLSTLDLQLQSTLPDYHEMAPLSINLLGGETTNVRRFRIAYLRVEWRVGMFKDLASLSLLGIEGDGLTSTHLVDSLLNSPQLELFELHSVSAAVHEPPQPSVINLNHLKTLRIAECTSQLTDLILRAIQAAHCTHFAVEATLDDSPSFSKFLNTTVQPFLRVWKAAHKAIGSSEISVSGIALCCDCNDEGRLGEPRFWLNLDGPLDPADLSFIHRTFEHESGLSLSLEDLSDAFWYNMASLRCVTQILSYSEYGELLARLAQPFPTGSSLPSFPNLENLCFYFAEDLENRDILDAVESRYGTLVWNTEKEPGLTIALAHHASGKLEAWRVATVAERERLMESKWIRSVEILTYERELIGALRLPDGREGTVYNEPI